jgi:hypothetical protein
MDPKAKEFEPSEETKLVTTATNVAESALKGEGRRRKTGKTRKTRKSRKSLKKSLRRRKH